MGISFTKTDVKTNLCQVGERHTPAIEPAKDEADSWNLMGMAGGNQSEFGCSKTLRSR